MRKSTYLTFGMIVCSGAVTGRGMVELFSDYFVFFSNTEERDGRIRADSNPDLLGSSELTFKLLLKYSLKLSVS